MTKCVPYYFMVCLFSI